MEYGFVLTGATPILFHADIVMLSDEVMAWRKDKANKTLKVPGDDRSPAWTWQTYLYHDGAHLAIPQMNVMAALRYAGAKIPATKGRGTFKSLTQSGLAIPTEYCKFTTNGQPVPLVEIQKLRNRSFAEQAEAAQDLGFQLFVNRAAVGQSKHVRVRAKFTDWEVSGTIGVSEPSITTDILEELFECAGALSGLLDWRPSSPKSPGPHGTFTSVVRPLNQGRKAN